MQVSQMSLFATNEYPHTVVGPIRTFALGVASVAKCDDCGNRDIYPIQVQTGMEYVPALNDNIPTFEWILDCCHSMSECGCIVENYTICPHCEECEECCSCVRCRYCGDRATNNRYGDNNICSNCEYCDDCCECLACEGCEEILTSDFCGDCHRCFDCDDCDEGSDGPEADDCPVIPIERLYVPIAYTGQHKSDFLDNFTFGVEIEHKGVNSETAENILEVLEVPTQGYTGYTHRNVTKWKIVPDGSLNRPQGYEAVSCVLSGSDGYEQIRAVMSALEANGGYVDNQCGLHVHIGGLSEMENKCPKYLARLLWNYRTVYHLMCKFVASDRKMGEWAEKSSSYDIDRVARATSDTMDDVVKSLGRMKACNLDAIRKYRTVEFRHLEGTLNHNVAIAWINLLKAFCLFSRECEFTDETDIRDFMDKMIQFGLDDASVDILCKKAGIARV